MTSGGEDWIEGARYRGPGVAWEEIVGLEHARREVAAVLAMLKRPDVAKRVGAELTPLLFIGDAGTGKTLTVRAIAQDMDLPLYTWPASEVDAALIKRIFAQLRTTRCVVFIDEIDMIAASRHSDEHSERTKAALVQLCSEVDGMDVLDGPLLIGATTTHERFLDDSLLRSGRFSTKISFNRPNEEERRELFERYARRLVVEGRIDWQEAAERSQGITGADVRAILNAGLALALADDHEGLTERHVLEALERRGHVRRLLEISPEERWTDAVHEAGHAVAAFSLFGPDSLNRVSIIPVANPYGLVRGHFRFRDEWRERQRETPDAWRREVMVGYGGMLAEELLLSGVGRGSSDDMGEVTRLVMSRILGGLDPDLGPLTPPTIESSGPFGSEAMRARIWSLAERHARELLERARRLLEPQRQAVANLAVTLNRSESLSGERLVDELRAAGAHEAPWHIAP